jgi:hypothetical protein
VQEPPAEDEEDELRDLIEVCLDMAGELIISSPTTTMGGESAIGEIVGDDCSFSLA